MNFLKNLLVRPTTTLQPKIVAPRITDGTYRFTHKFKDSSVEFEREDPYFYIRKLKKKKTKSNTQPIPPQVEKFDVMEYLKAENDFTQEQLQHTTTLQEELFKECYDRSNWDQDKQSLPYWMYHVVGDTVQVFSYYHRMAKTDQHKTYCRKLLFSFPLIELHRGATIEAMHQKYFQESTDHSEQILINLNELASEEDQSVVSLGFLKVSDDGQFLAYGVDETGDEIYTLYIKDLQTNTILCTFDSEDLSEDFEWCSDNKTFFFTTLDDSFRPYKLFRGTLQPQQSSKKKQPSHSATTKFSISKQTIYTEKDEKFHLYLSKSASGKYLFLELESQITSETRVLESSQPTKEWKTMVARSNGVEYSVEHDGKEGFYVLENSNKQTNFRLVHLSLQQLSATSFEQCKELIPHRSDVFLDYFVPFQNYLAVFVREMGLPKLFIYSIDDFSTPKAVHFSDHTECYELSSSNNAIFETDIIRLRYSSFVTPVCKVDYHMKTGVMEEKRRKEVRHYKAEDYGTERIVLPTEDGTAQLAILLVYKKNLFAKDGKNPLLLYGYGAYGECTDASFDSSIFSLLNRGFVYGIAQVRGGGEFGRHFYESGKLLSKKNTFVDFETCAQYLLKHQYTSKEKLCISGASAGGLLIAACINQNPSLYRCAILNVPFVDVIGSMCDSTLPLVFVEYDEWGNPSSNPTTFQYMMEYSPYDNIVKTEKSSEETYPAMLVTSGLQDSRVQYFEPTKYVAQMRWYLQHRQEARLILLKTELEEGHAGKTGRFSRLKEIVFQFAFLIDQVLKQ